MQLYSGKRALGRPGTNRQNPFIINDSNRMSTALNDTNSFSSRLSVNKVPKKIDKVYYLADVKPLTYLQAK